MLSGRRIAANVWLFFSRQASLSCRTRGRLRCQRPRNRRDPREFTRVTSQGENDGYGGGQGEVALCLNRVIMYNAEGFNAFAVIVQQAKK